MQKSRNNYLEIGKYMENQIKCMELYIKPIKMNGKWLGNIQPMCSAPGAFPPGAFFRQKSAPFPKKCLFVCFYDKTSLFIIKRPDPGGFARLRAGSPLQQPSYQLLEKKTLAKSCKRCR